MFYQKLGIAQRIGCAARVLEATMAQQIVPVVTRKWECSPKFLGGTSQPLLRAEGKGREERHPKRLRQVFRFE
jgi:hypothetical protein